MVSTLHVERVRVSALARSLGRLRAVHALGTPKGPGVAVCLSRPANGCRPSNTIMVVTYLHGCRPPILYGGDPLISRVKAHAETARGMACGLPSQDWPFRSSVSRDTVSEPE